MRIFFSGRVFVVPLLSLSLSLSLLIFLVSCAPSYQRGVYSAYPPVGTPAPLGSVTETDLAPIESLTSSDSEFIETLGSGGEVSSDLAGIESGIGSDVDSGVGSVDVTVDSSGDSRDAFISSLESTLSGGEGAADGSGVVDSGSSTSTSSTSSSSDFLSAADIASVSGPELTHKSIVGAWTVTISDTNCQVFLALTRWSGGYRAASRGCRVGVMSDVQAWDVRDNRIILVGSDGARSAILGRSGAERFEGKTSGGDDVMFTR